MGGTTSTQDRTSNQQGTSTTTPYANTGPALTNLVQRLGALPSISTGQDQALTNLSNLGAAGNRFAPGIGGVADTLLGGGGAGAQSGTFNDAYQRYIQQANPTARGDYLNPNTNPFFAQTTADISRNAADQIKGVYAGSGRSLAGAGSLPYNIGRGVGEATAPIYSGVYNQERQNQLGAAGNLFGAGSTTGTNLTNLNQLSLGNMQAGIGAAGAANQAEQYGPMLQLQAEAQRQGIPLQTLLAQLGGIGGIGQAFGTTNANQTGTQQTQTSTPFNPLSLAPLAFLPLSGSGSSSLAGSALSGLRF